MKLLYLYILIGIHLGCRMVQPIGNRAGKDSTASGQSIPPDLTIISKNVALLKTQVNSIITSNPQLSTNQLNQVNTLIAASKTSILKILQDSMKNVSTLRLQISDLQRRDALHKIIEDSLIKKVDNLIKLSLIPRSDQFTTDGGVLGIKKITGADSLIVAP